MGAFTKNPVLRKIFFRRKEIGYTQEDVALRLGLKPAAYSSLENGINNMSLSHFLKIADILKIKPEELLAPEVEEDLGNLTPEERLIITNLRRVRNSRSKSNFERRILKEFSKAVAH